MSNDFIKSFVTNNPLLIILLKDERRAMSNFSILSREGAVS